MIKQFGSELNQLCAIWGDKNLEGLCFCFVLGGTQAKAGRYETLLRGLQKGDVAANIDKITEHYNVWESGVAGNG